MLDNSSIQYYLLKIHIIVNALASIGDPISISHHIDVILEGLLVDFAPIVSYLKASSELWILMSWKFC